MTMTTEPNAEKPTKYLFRLSDLNSADLKDRIADFLDQVVPKTTDSDSSSKGEGKQKP